MAKFERVSAYPDAILPTRATKGSAGYDFAAAEDIVVPPMEQLMDKLYKECYENNLEKEIGFAKLEEIVKLAKAKVTLVPTGIKCQLDTNTYLELSARSSLPLKHWLVVSNGVGVIDSDYYNNKDNDGHIYFQLINLSPVPIRIPKGTKIGQGIIKPYLVTEDDAACGQRNGGFGSTNQ